jgi:hypothetical protein
LKASDGARVLVECDPCVLPGEQLFQPGQDLLGMARVGEWGRERVQRLAPALGKGRRRVGGLIIVGRLALVWIRVYHLDRHDTPPEIKL